MTFGTELLDKQREIEEYGVAGNEAVSRLADYMQRRAALSEAYARGLQKLARRFAPTQPQDLGMSDLLHSADSTIAAHMQFFEEVQGPLLDGMRVTAREHERKRREALAEVRSVRASWKKSLAVFERAQRARNAAVKAVDDACVMFERANNDINATKASVQRLWDDYVAKTRNTLAAKEEYALQARALSDQQRVFYTQDLPVLFDRMQQIEEARLTRVKMHLIEFGQLVEAAVSSEHSRMRGMLQSWRTIEPAVLMRQFIETTASPSTEPFQYPEEFVVDECASLHPPSAPKASEAKPTAACSQGSAHLPLPAEADADLILARIRVLQEEHATAGKQYDGIEILHQLNAKHPELSDEHTNRKMELQLAQLASQISAITAEHDELVDRLESLQICDKSATARTPRQQMALEDEHPRSPSPGKPASCLTAIEVQGAKEAPPSPSPLAPSKLEGAVLFQARAIEDFAPGGAGENLSITAGELLDVYSKSGTWWLCRNAHGSTGYVPSRRLQIET